MYEIEETYLSSTEMEDQLLQNFGEEFLVEAMRVVQTNSYTKFDGPMIHQAMCVIVAMYIRKLKSGEFYQNRVLH